jgi:hypothetical protein
MLIRTIVVAAPLLLGAGQEGGSSAPSKEKQEERQTSLPGPSGAQGGTGTNSGAEGARKDQTAAGEKGDIHPDARAGGASAAPPGAQGAPGGHAADRTISGKLSQVSDGSITIETGPGKSHTLKLAPATKITSGGKDAAHGDLEEGQQVRASYMEHGGEQIAVRIQASGGAAEPEREKTHNPRNNPQAEKK